MYTRKERRGRYIFRLHEEASVLTVHDNNSSSTEDLELHIGSSHGFFIVPKVVDRSLGDPAGGGTGAANPPPVAL